MPCLLPVGQKGSKPLVRERVPGKTSQYRRRYGRDVGASDDGRSLRYGKGWRSPHRGRPPQCRSGLEGAPVGQAVSMPQMGAGSFPVLQAGECLSTQFQCLARRRVSRRMFAMQTQASADASSFEVPCQSSAPTDRDGLLHCVLIVGVETADADRPVANTARSAAFFRPALPTKMCLGRPAR